MPILPPRSDIGANFDFRDFQKKAPFGSPFQAKKATKSYCETVPDASLDRPWRDPRPKVVPRRPETRCSQILNRFGMDVSWFWLPNPRSILLEPWPTEMRVRFSFRSSKLQTNNFAETGEAFYLSLHSTAHSARPSRNYQVWEVLHQKLKCLRIIGRLLDASKSTKNGRLQSQYHKSPGLGRPRLRALGEFWHSFFA